MKLKNCNGIIYIGTLSVFFLFFLLSLLKMVQVALPSNERSFQDSLTVLVCYIFIAMSAKAMFRCVLLIKDEVNNND